MTTVVCAACGAQQGGDAREAGARFCGVCGTPLPGARGGLDARVAITTEPEARGMTRQGPVGDLRAPAGAPAVGAPYAGVGRRVGAYVLDAVAVGLAAGLAATLVALAVGLPARMAALSAATTTAGLEAAGRELTGALVRVYAVVALVALAGWVVLAAAEGRTGRTVGNRLLGIQTVAASSGAPIGFGRALLRWLVVVVAGILPVVGTVLVLLSPLRDPRRQGWHDRAARAVVTDVRGLVPASFAPPRFAPARTGRPSVAAPDTPTPAAAPAAAAPLADLWAFPAGPRTPSSGLITGVPGMGTGTGMAAAAEALDAMATGAEQPAPQPPTIEAPAAPATPVAPGAAHEDVDATRFSVTSQRSTGDAPPRRLAVTIVLESGRRVLVDGRALLGRNPQQDAGERATLVRVEDPTRTVSKTHLELRPGEHGLQLTDRGSTNGTAVIAPDGAARELEQGVPVTVSAGWTVQVGDRRFTVLGPGAPA
jgi:RDD family